MGIGETERSAHVGGGYPSPAASQTCHLRSHPHSTSHSLPPWTSDLSPQSLSVLLGITGTILVTR